MKAGQRYSFGRGGCRAQQGISLVEFMIASTIGLVLIVGAATLMLSVQQGRVFKQDLDHMQENFRYGTNIIMRVVRQGTSFADPSGDVGIKVSLAPGTNMHDCLGRDGAESNTFFVNANGELSCKVVRNGSSEGPYALAEGFSAPLQVDYGFDSNADGVVDTYRAVADSAEWSVPVSARITLSSHNQSVQFVVTMRPAAVAGNLGAIP